MVASREAMNMGARSSNVISELKSVISLLGQATDSAFQKVTSGISRASSFGGSGTSASNTLVAPNPVFNAPPLTTLTQTGSGVVASGPSSSLVARGAGPNLSEYAAQTGTGSTYQSEGSSVVARGAGNGAGSRIFGGGGGGGSSSSSSSSQGWANIPGIGDIIGAAFGAYNVGANLTPNTSDVLEAQLLQQRASFYAGGGKDGIGGVQTNQQNIAEKAMLAGDNPQMDVMRAQIAAQSYGLGASSNKLLSSAANVSNLMPGLGVEGAIRATGAMQQASNVNMLRGIGIQLRDPVTGSLKGADEVIEQVWKKICRDYSQSGQGKSPGLNEVQISLQPGNALDSMLNQYFGNDPMLKQLVANGLIYKAQGGGDITKAGVAGLGGTTSAMISYTSTAAAGQGFLVKAESGADTGFQGANVAIRDYYDKAAKDLVAVVSGIKGFTDTILTAFGGNPLSAGIGVSGVNAISGFASTAGTTMNLLKDPAGTFKDALTNIFKGFIPGLAVGGPADSNTPYIVGEKGPELFVPSTNGTVIPNNQLGTGSTYNYSFTINAASGSTQDLVTEIKSVLVQLETNKKVSES
jgi:hypothetical protein